LVPLVVPETIKKLISMLTDHTVFPVGQICM
jgi:hypothetical protein